MGFHPLFPAIQSINRRAIEKICNRVMVEKSYRSSEEVFNEGDMAQGMYFVMSGMLRYRTLLFKLPRELRQGDAISCIAEALVGPLGSRGNAGS